MAKRRSSQSAGTSQMSLFDAATAMSPVMGSRCLEGIHSWRASATREVMVCVHCGATTTGVFRGSLVKRVD